MNKHQPKLQTALTCLCVAAATTAQPAHSSNITQADEIRPEMICMTPLADGETYASISDNGRVICRRSFKTGEVVDTIFSSAQARGHKIEYVSSFIMSPDEKTLLIETQRTPIYRRSATAYYYIYDVRNHTIEPLSKNGSQECPKYSPDGNMVAFVRDNNLYLVKLLYNNAESQVTKDGVFGKIINGKPDWVYEEEFTTNCSFDFSADSEMLAWIRTDETAVKTFSFTWFKGDSPAREDHALYPGTYEYKYPKAGEENAKVSVLTYDIKSRQTRTMQVPLDSDGYIPRIQFTGQKDMLMVSTLNRRQDRLDFYLVNARSGTAQLALREKDDRYVDEAAYLHNDFSRDQFVLLSERDGFRHMYLYSINGQLVRQLTSGNFEVTEYYGCDASGKNFYFASNEGSPLDQHIYKVDTNGRRTKISGADGWHDAVFSKGCRYWLDFHSSFYERTTCALRQSDKPAKASESKAETRTPIADRIELLTITTSDGIELNGWIVKPKDFDPNKKYPVLLYQYSGPGSQSVTNSDNNGFEDMLFHDRALSDRGTLFHERALADKGMIVACFDGRGTGGRGAEFRRCTYMKMGDIESHDQAEVALWLGKQPYVDASRIGIWGWSFGGFNTLMALCEGRGLFRCGVAVAPVTDWRFYDTVYTERYMRTPQENPEGYDCSPLHRIDKMKGDLLLIHGMADDNVHFQNTAELAEALVQAGVQFDMQVYTNRNHTIRGGNTRNHLKQRIEDFLMTHLVK